MSAALEARQIKASDNVVADVEGDIGEVDGVLRIVEIRLHYCFTIPAKKTESVERVLQSYAAQCPAYQSIKDCIPCSWNAVITEL